MEMKIQVVSPMGITGIQLPDQEGRSLAWVTTLFQNWDNNRIAGVPAESNPYPKHLVDQAVVNLQVKYQASKHSLEQQAIESQIMSLMKAYELYEQGWKAYASTVTTQARGLVSSIASFLTKSVSGAVHEVRDLASLAGEKAKAIAAESKQIGAVPASALLDVPVTPLPATAQAASMEVLIHRITELEHKLAVTAAQPTATPLVPPTLIPDVTEENAQKAFEKAGVLSDAKGTIINS